MPKISSFFEWSKNQVSVINAITGIAMPPGILNPVAAYLSSLIT